MDTSMGMGTVTGTRTPAAASEGGVGGNGTRGAADLAENVTEVDGWELLPVDDVTVLPPTVGGVGGFGTHNAPLGFEASKKPRWIGFSRMRHFELGQCYIKYYDTAAAHRVLKGRIDLRTVTAVRVPQVSATAVGGEVGVLSRCCMAPSLVCPSSEIWRAKLL
jgi:hypothetical protein